MAVSTKERERRVAAGSRRKRDRDAVGAPSLLRQSERDAAKRDLEAAAQRGREERLRPLVRESDEAAASMPYVLDACFESVTRSTFHLWFARPLECLGEVEGAFAFAAPERSLGWLLRRYGHLLGAAVRSATDYRGAFLFLAETTTDESDGLL